MPCVAKKGEREMDLFYGEYAGHDVDAVLTTRELVKMIRSAHIRPDTLVEIPSDSPMHGGTGAGVIFGATGGVMEAALRTAYFTLKGENPPADAFRAVRSEGFQENAGVQEAEFEIGDIKLRCGYAMSRYDAYVNIAGGMKMNEPALDLAVVMALVSSFKNREVDPGMLIFGEVGLSGEVRGVSQAAQRVSEAIKMGFTSCLLPKSNLEKLKDEKRIRLIGVENVREAIQLI